MAEATHKIIFHSDLATTRGRRLAHHHELSRGKSTTGFNDAKAGLEQHGEPFEFDANRWGQNPTPTLFVHHCLADVEHSLHEPNSVQPRSVCRANSGLHLHRSRSHDQIRTSFYIPQRVKDSAGVLRDTLPFDKYTRSPSETYKHVVARSLLCDEPSRVCMAARSSPSAHAKADRKNTTKRTNLHRPCPSGGMERHSAREVRNWRRVFLLANYGREPLIKSGNPEEGDHGETASVSNCRS
jgi:hypothetical protein